LFQAFLLLAAGISVAVAFPQYNYDPPPSVPSGLYELPSEPSNQEETKELLNEPTNLDDAKLPFSPVISVSIFLPLPLLLLTNYCKTKLPEAKTTANTILLPRFIQSFTD